MLQIGALPKLGGHVQLGALVAVPWQSPALLAELPNKTQYWHQFNGGQGTVGKTNVSIAPQFSQQWGLSPRLLGQLFVTRSSTVLADVRETAHLLITMVGVEDNKPFQEPEAQLLVANGQFTKPQQYLLTGEAYDEKTTPVWSSVQYNPLDQHQHRYLDPVAEYNMLNGQRANYYRGADNRLLMKHDYKGGEQGNKHWCQFNAKQDVVGLTMHNGGTHRTYHYDPFGGVIAENGDFKDQFNHYTLTGKEFDENTGLMWFGARHYDPRTGSWMTQDLYRGMLNDPMSLHRLMYVFDNPVFYVDENGFAIRIWW